MFCFLCRFEATGKRHGLLVEGGSVLVFQQLCGGGDSVGEWRTVQFVQLSTVVTNLKGRGNYLIKCDPSKSGMWNHSFS